MSSIVIIAILDYDYYDTIVKSVNEEHESKLQLSCMVVGVLYC